MQFLNICLLKADLEDTDIKRRRTSARTVAAVGYVPHEQGWRRNQFLCLHLGVAGAPDIHPRHFVLRQGTGQL